MFTNTVIHQTLPTRSTFLEEMREGFGGEVEGRQTDCGSDGCGLNRFLLIRCQVWRVGQAQDSINLQATSMVDIHGPPTGFISRQSED